MPKTKAIDTATEPRLALLSVQQVAVLLSVDKSTVRRWIKDKTLRGVRIGKKLVRIRYEDVEKLIKPS